LLLSLLSLSLLLLQLGVSHTLSRGFYLHIPKKPRPPLHPLFFRHRDVCVIRIESDERTAIWWGLQLQFLQGEYVFMYVYVYVYIYIYVYIFTYTYIFVYTWIYVYRYIYIYMYIYISVCLNTYIYIHIYIYILAKLKWHNENIGGGWSAACRHISERGPREGFIEHSSDGYWDLRRSDRWDMYTTMYIYIYIFVCICVYVLYVNMYIFAGVIGDIYIYIYI
jgi:hypothetical protein